MWYGYSNYNFVTYMPFLSGEMIETEFYGFGKGSISHWHFRVFVGSAKCGGLLCLIVVKYLLALNVWSA